MRIQIPEWSIRRQIMVCVIATLLIMGMALTITIVLNQKSLESIGSSYKTNAELTEISTNLAGTEKALESYMEYRTFESINSYYQFQSVSEAAIKNLQDEPSTNTIRQKEYIVRQMTESFFYYSGNAVIAQRANNTVEMEENYRKSLTCYTLLQSQIEELNILFMRANAESYAEHQRHYRLLTRISIVFIVSFFLLILLLLYISVSIITRPLFDISSVALRVAGMDFDIPLFNSRAQNEIGNICRAFDRMIVSIREYIDKIWEKVARENEMKERELEMRELYANAQLRALQSQINPHFLFNTLNTGAQLAMIEGADKTCYFVEQVADFFRYNIQQKEQTASISEELALVDNFVYIMKVRFEDRFTFVKHIPEERTYTQRLPRMTLQPLVENCIKHGLKDTPGTITLSLREDASYIYLSIMDDGCGFPPDLRESVLSADTPAEGKGTGLINVISRLRIYFHADDVFDILPNKAGGTTFLIRIPHV